MKNISLYKKILIVLAFSVGFTILFAFFFIHYLYSELYLSSVEESIIYQGKRTASHYHYGELNDEIIRKIQWYNIVSEYEVIVVDNLEELSSYFPYKINYETLIDADDQSTLEHGKYVMKKGFVEELNREIIGAIFPIKDEKKLIGFIYIYVPLAAIKDVFQGSIPILIMVGTLFFIILFLVVNRIWRSMLRPLKRLQKIALEVSQGNYRNQIEIERYDEIGQLTKAFNQMNLSLAQQERRQREFTSSIVHELRTPLTYIGGYTEALKQKIYKSPDEAKNYLITIEKETDRLNKLIQDLVDLNYLQENLYSIEQQPTAISQLLFDAIDFFNIHMTEKKLQLKLDVAEDLIVMGDAKRIYQIFFNTIDNAIKYSRFADTISIRLKKINQSAVYRINNGGMVIKDEDIERIGERFFRTDKARNRKTGGTGLGLSIVKEIVRLHQGTFTITSHQGKGTTVTIKLPCLNTEGVD